MKKSSTSSVNQGSKAGKKSLNLSEFKEIKEPTNIKGYTPDKEGRVSIGYTHEGEQKWIYDGKEEISFEDGFRMSTGQESVPGRGAIQKGWNRRWDNAYDRVFNHIKEN